MTPRSGIPLLTLDLRVGTDELSAGIRNNPFLSVLQPLKDLE
jgi:hypothetical protein